MIGSLLAALLATATPQTQQKSPDIALWRLDCGTLQMHDFGRFADDFSLEGTSKELSSGCYLIKHGEEYLLWDTGLPGDLAGKSRPVGSDATWSLRRTITDQLKELGLTPAQVKYVGVSHYHYDHTGQLGDFPHAILLIGRQDLEYVRNNPPPSLNVTGFAPWLTGGAEAVPVARDHDVFGDKSVVLLAMPGHTSGHHALLVRLKGMGAVLLSGDQFHSTESYDRNLVPAFNRDRAGTLASHARFKDIARSLKATVIVQHETRDVAKLPAFPQAAR